MPKKDKLFIIKKPRRPNKVTYPLKQLVSFKRIDIKGRASLQSIIDSILGDVRLNEVILICDIGYERGCGGAYSKVYIQYKEYRDNPDYEKELSLYEGQVEKYKEDMIKYKEDIKKYEEDQERIYEELKQKKIEQLERELSILRGMC